MIPQERIEELETAIRTHRDQRGDDRCWLDDVELYAVLHEDKQPFFALPAKQEFLGNCARYWECRQKFEDKAEAVAAYKGGS